jgi:hypothetical protein
VIRHLSRRAWHYLVVAGLRSTLSWTSWRLRVRLRRTVRKHRRAEARALLLLHLRTVELAKVNRLREQGILLEQRLHPLQVPPQPHPPTLVALTNPEPRPETQHLHLLTQGRPEPSPTPEERSRSAEQEVADLVKGLTQHPSSPSSET